MGVLSRTACIVWQLFVVAVSFRIRIFSCVIELEFESWRKTQVPARYCKVASESCCFLLFLAFCYYKFYFCWYCVGVLFSDHGNVFWILLFGSDPCKVFLYWYWVVACACPSCGPSKHMASETSWLHWRTEFRHTKLRLSRERLNLLKGRTRAGFNSLKRRTPDCVDDSFLRREGRTQFAPPIESMTHFRQLLCLFNISSFKRNDLVLSCQIPFFSQRVSAL